MYYKRNLNYLYRFLNEKKCAKVRGCYQRDAFIYLKKESGRIFQGFMLLISFCTWKTRIISQSGRTNISRYKYTAKFTTYFFFFIFIDFDFRNEIGQSIYFTWAFNNIVLEQKNLTLSMFHLIPIQNKKGIYKTAPLQNKKPTLHPIIENTVSISRFTIFFAARLRAELCK